jgi:hypothetical protein
VASCDIKSAITDGINLVYFSDLTAKTVFIEKVVNDLRGKKILILDFDTQFSALKANGCLSPTFYESNGPEIFLPDLALHLEIVDKIQEALRLNVTIILDSLNGLMDYFNSTLIWNKKKLSMVETFNTNKNTSEGRASNNSIGHLALFILKILFTSPLINGMSIILTSYLSHRSVDALGIRLVNLESDSLSYETHFERLSQSIAVLRYDRERKSLYYTRILNPKNFPDNSGTLDHPKSFQLK